MADDDDLLWSSSTDRGSEVQLFDRNRHIMYLQMNYEILPSGYEGQEINRLTLAYFIISGLHILHALDHVSPRRLFP